MSEEHHNTGGVQLEEQLDQFSEQLVSCYEEISILQESSETLGQLIDRQTIADATLSASLRVTGAERGAFYACEDGVWKKQTGEGYLSDELPSHWAEVLLERQRPFIQNHAGSGSLGDLAEVGPDVTTFLAAPLVGQDRLTGIVVLADAARGQFESSDAKMVQSIAKQAATALNNEEHHTQLMAAQEELLVSQKFAAMGEMAAEIGHELNNYLTSILGQVEISQVLVETGKHEGLDKRFQTIVSQVDKMGVLTQGLLRCSKKELKPQACKLHQVIGEAVAFVSPQNRFDFTQFSVSVPEDLPPLLLDPNQIQQVFLNLFTNAADAMGEKGGTITVTASMAADKESAEIRISDEGPGIPEELRRRVFEPRFTTKSKGNGFGLAVCFRVCQDHGGTIRLQSDDGPGAAFVVTLPLGKAQDRSFLREDPSD
jgi:signal transduction histidine kinase